MSLTNIQGRGYALQGIAGITRRKRCFIGRKIGLLFVFCLVLSMTRDSQAFAHCEESSFQTSWPRVQEDDQMVIRGAGEQRHLSLSSAPGRGRGVNKVSMCGDACVAAHGVVHTPHPTVRGPFQLWPHLS